MNASAVLIAQAHYLRMGVVQISMANLIVIVLMVITLVLALVVPFPRGHEESGGFSDGQH
jgi:hypothetical protein